MVVAKVKRGWRNRRQAVAPCVGKATMKVKAHVGTRGRKGGTADKKEREQSDAKQSAKTKSVASRME